MYPLHPLAGYYKYILFFRDSWGRLHTEVVAIDAKPRIGYTAQFSPGHIKRELEKVGLRFRFFIRNNSIISELFFPEVQ